MPCPYFEDLAGGSYGDRQHNAAVPGFYGLNLGGSSRGGPGTRCQAHPQDVTDANYKAARREKSDYDRACAPVSGHLPGFTEAMFRGKDTEMSIEQPERSPSRSNLHRGMGSIWEEGGRQYAGSAFPCIASVGVIY